MHALEFDHAPSLSPTTRKQWHIKGHRRTRNFATLPDKLRSYFKPIRNLAPDADHRAHKGLNNLVEGSHRPTRRREKIMGRFKSQRLAQRFLAAHDQINTLFRPRRYRLTASSYRHARADAFSLWNDYALEMNA
ncbi:DDE-type integrase/transposase/recombinase [Paracoccus kondratievae]|uniref:DDE-type integrase/transposase/recombinase n=1 Tax=Paracoccus kondratievae TaxID=135740 RepID=UPI00362B8CCB